MPAAQWPFRCLPQQGPRPTGTASMGSRQRCSRSDAPAAAAAPLLQLLCGQQRCPCRRSLATAAVSQGSTFGGSAAAAAADQELELLARQLSGSMASTSTSSSTDPWDQDDFLDASEEDDGPWQEQQEQGRHQQQQQQGRSLQQRVRALELQQHLQQHQQRRPRPRYTVADKLQLKPEQALDIMRRLRTEEVPPGHSALRVFRYAIDDLRLYKAVDVAGLEGWLVVVDSVEAADVVLATRAKRTGKVVDLGPTRRAAAAAGLPMVELPAVSAQRLLEGLGPILGLQLDKLPLLQRQREGARGPRLLRQEEVVEGGGELLLGLLWGLEGEGGPQAGRQRMWEQRVAGMQDPAAWVAGDLLDEGTREHLLPANPNQRAGEKVKLARPLRHGSKLKRRRLAKILAEQAAPW